MVIAWVHPHSCFIPSRTVIIITSYPLEKTAIFFISKNTWYCKNEFTLLFYDRRAADKGWDTAPQSFSLKPGAVLHCLVLWWSCCLSPFVPLKQALGFHSSERLVFFPLRRSRKICEIVREEETVKQENNFPISWSPSLNRCPSFSFQFVLWLTSDVMQPRKVPEFSDFILLLCPTQLFFTSRS